MSGRDHSLIHRLFEQQASATPDAIAVVLGAAAMRYGELDARANQLAHRLQKSGVGPESLVGLLVERSIDMVVGVLGILKAGGAYVPVDATMPPDRVTAILEDAGVSVAVTQAALAERLPSSLTDVVRLDADLTALADGPRTPPAAVLSGESAAYVIYTSGSTGKPKGVLVTHHNVVRLFVETQHWFQFGSRDVWTLFHSIAFDVSVGELWGALFYGGRLVVVPQDTARSPDRLQELLAREQVTVLRQTPSAFRMLMQPDASSKQTREFALRLIIFAGEALDLQSLRPWIERHGDDVPQLINMYGITETTVDVMYRRIRVDDLDRGLGSVIGEPIPDLSVYLLDEHQQPVPVGAPGEMYVGGAGVARGYLNRPELTAERFLRDPFAGVPGARMYRSGDQARQFADGDLEYLGRLDTQVKIRGFRIELGEIEAAIRNVPGILETVVVARTNIAGEKTLVAYYTDDGHAPESLTPALRAQLSDGLPEYMVPSRFVRLDRIPLTINGKVDRKALPPSGRKRPELGCPMVSPRTGVERWVASHWADVLDLDEVGVHDPLFELGGTSLSAVRLMERLSRDAGASLPEILPFQAPTVAEMARVIGKDYRSLIPSSVVGDPAVAMASADPTPEPRDERATGRGQQRRDALARRPRGHQ